MQLCFELNGRELRIETPEDRRVVDLLREDLGLTGSKEGCGTGECGACSILVDGQSRLGCLMLAAQLSGTRVTTIEGLAATPDGQRIQQAFVEEGAVQCGYCIPGMEIAAKGSRSRRSATCPPGVTYLRSIPRSPSTPSCPRSAPRSSP